ncbi:MAG TPA: hypothetical protein VF651_00805 [Gammaproteobacteria bacterium]
MTSLSRVTVFLTAALSLCVCGAAQAKSHLSRDELKVLSNATVAVVYMDSDRAVWPYIDRHSGTTPMSMALADDLNERQYQNFLARVTPYQGTLDRLSLPDSNRKAVQDALASVSFLHEAPWVTVVPDPKDHLFMREQGLKTKANVVIFIRPRLELNDDADGLYMVTLIDIETLDATGTTLQHYESAEVSTDVDVDDDKLPPVAGSPAPGTGEEDIRAARLFADDGAGFKPFYFQLLKQAQQKLYYFFTGEDTPPPPAAAAAAK